MLELQAMIQLNDLLPVISEVTLATFLAFVLSMAMTPIYTALAYKHKWWKKARTTDVTGQKSLHVHAQEADKHKRKFPTMAGMIIIAAVTLVTLILNLDRNQTWLPLFAFVAAGLVGLVDDYINVRGSSHAAGGLRVKLKFLLITGVAVLGASYFYYKLGYHLMHIPLVGDISIGWGYIPLFIAVVVSTANAVNITDGFDGLAGGLTSMAFGAYAIIAFLQGNYGIAIFCATVVGAMLSYTWFNIYPARFLMGDSGAFALGTTLGVVAMLTNAVFVLPIVGGIFVLEAGSSLLQIFSKKVFKRKIFLAAPIHHHFRALGWPETKVVMRFWVLGAICSVLGLVVAVVGRQL